jgi:hypothetical protein
MSTVIVPVPDVEPVPISVYVVAQPPLEPELDGLPDDGLFDDGLFDDGLFDDGLDIAEILDELNADNDDKELLIGLSDALTDDTDDALDNKLGDFTEELIDDFDELTDNLEELPLDTLLTDTLENDDVGMQQAPDTTYRGTVPSEPVYAPTSLALYVPLFRAIPFGSQTYACSLSLNDVPAHCWTSPW